MYSKGSSRSELRPDCVTWDDGGFLMALANDQRSLRTVCLQPENLVCSKRRLVIGQ